MIFSKSTGKAFHVKFQYRVKTDYLALKKCLMANVASEKTDSA